jgi:hypothetical protein
MFDASSCFKFNKLNKDKALNSKHLQSVQFYSFRTKKHHYIVEVEIYEYHIYVVKYYLKKHKNHKYKYNMLTGEHKAAGVITTCIYIILDLLKADPMASFGFIGSPTYNVATKKMEPADDTKRFRIYKAVMENLIGDQTFVHTFNPRHSAYLMLNKRHKDIGKMQNLANQMFLDIFPVLGGF